MADFPTLSITAAAKITVGALDSAIKSPFEGGYQHSRPRFTRQPRVFECAYTGLNDADVATLEAFFDTVHGGSDSFTWNRPRSASSYTVRFQTRPKIESIEPGKWAMSFTLEEV